MLLYYRVIFLLLFLMLGSGGLHAQQEAKSDTAKSLVSIEILMPSTVMVGEPILLCYRLANLSNDNVTFHQFRPRTASYHSWLSFELQDEKKKTIAKQEPRRAAFAFPGMNRVSANTTYEREIVLPARLRPQTPGKFTFLVPVSLPYTVEGETKTRLLQTTLTLPVLAIPTDKKALERTAKQLAEKIEGESTGTFTNDIEALFSMSEDVLPVWHSLATSSRVSDNNKRLIERELGAMESPVAVDLLIKLWGGANAPVPNFGAKGILQDLYRTTSSPSLKEYIRQKFAAAGGNHDELYDGNIISDNGGGAEVIPY